MLLFHTNPYSHVIGGSNLCSEIQCRLHYVVLLTYVRTLEITLSEKCLAPKFLIVFLFYRAWYKGQHHQYLIAIIFVASFYFNWFAYLGPSAPFRVLQPMRAHPCPVACNWSLNVPQVLLPVKILILTPGIQNAMQFSTCLQFYKIAKQILNRMKLSS